MSVLGTERRRAIDRRSASVLAVVGLALGNLAGAGPATASGMPALLTVNIAPVGTPDVYTTAFQATLLVAAPGVLGNDIDLDGDPLSAQLVAGPDHGTLSLSADGGFRYQPDGGFSGLDVFTYRPFDGTAPALVAATVSITVLAAPLSTPTPTPSQTSTPTPSPTPSPTPKPTPTPSLTPSPTPTSRATPTPTPASEPPTPAPSAGPSRSPSPTATPRPTLTDTPLQSPPPEPDVSPSPSLDPEASALSPSTSPEPVSPLVRATVKPTGSPGAGAHVDGDQQMPDGSSDNVSVLLFGEPDVGPVSFRSPADLTVSMEWVVPTFLLTVPGILMIAIALAQIAGGLAWLPLVRRLLGGDGRRRRRGR